jgi:hypothetical protein
MDAGLALSGAAHGEREIQNAFRSRPDRRCGGVVGAAYVHDTTMIKCAAAGAQAPKAIVNRDQFFAAFGR